MKPRILIVEPRDGGRVRIGAWLAREGYDVMFCPGPQSPGYVCLGGRGSVCPLSDGADVVVLDMRLRSDELMIGTPGWQLLLYYYEQGKRIVAISGPDDPIHLLPDDRVRTIGRPVERERLIDAVRSLTPLAQSAGM